MSTILPNNEPPIWNNVTRSTKATRATFSVCLSCGSKMKESNKNDSSTVSGEVSAEGKKTEEVAARRARLEAARTEKAEQRRLAAIEAAKTSPTYKDAGKKIYKLAEVSPSYVGGNDAMIKHLHD